MELKELKDIIDKKISKIGVRYGVGINRLEKILYVIADCRNQYDAEIIRSCINNLLNYLYTTRGALFASRNSQEGNIYIIEVLEYEQLVR